MMEFSRAIAQACFTATKWLMVVTGTLFLLLAAAQHYKEEPNADPYLTIGTGIGCLFLALLLHFMAQRLQAMNAKSLT